MKRALITGAAGFIGRHLVKRLLADGHEVVALIHREPGPFQSLPGVREIPGDIRDAATMITAAEGCDTIFHLAGRVHALSETEGDQSLYDSLNVNGTRNLLEAGAAGGARRFIFFSSVKALGEGGAKCLDEDSQSAPETAYGLSKLAAERLVFDYGAKTGMHVACLRLPLVYGPGNKGNLFRMIAAIDRGRFPPLPKIENRRSMVHVSNVVDAALAAADQPQANGRCYIVTDRDAYSTSELYQMICDGLGRKSSSWAIPSAALNAIAKGGDLVGRLRGKRFVFDSDALEKLIGSAWYSSERISRELGYQPRLNFRDSLPELIDWYRTSSP